MDEYQIVELAKDRYRTGSIKAVNNFLLNDTTIIWIESYKHSYQHNPSINKQVTGYVYNDTTRVVSELELPTLINWDLISYAYLYKKGYVVIGDGLLGPAPLPNLKYIIYYITSGTGFSRHEFKDRLVIELVDVDVVANNVNLPKFMSSVLGPKLLSENKINKNKFYQINHQMRSQNLFAGHTWDDAYGIVYRYFDENKRELSKDVFKILVAYQQVFRPYRVVYNTKTWEPVLV